MAKFKEITKEAISSFLSGSNPMERIIKTEIGYDDDKIVVFYRDENGQMQEQKEDFLPFVWTKQSVARTYFNADRSILKSKMSEYGIECKGLIVEDRVCKIHPRMENGYRVMFYAKIPMSFSKFMKFFIEAGRPIYPKETDKSYGLKDYIVVAPDEQHMIRTGKRFFKGYDDYDDLIRVLWDLETEGLDPTKDLITKIGIKTNKGFEKIITIRGEGEEKYNNELPAIREFFEILSDINPDVICGHNTENFDWNFIDVRLQQHGTTLFEFTAPYFKGRGIYKKKKEKVLKLGGETEYYFPTVKYGTNLTDSLHAVRRAQAIDSNMKKADLKYVTKYSKLNKPNRVYVPGKIINSTSEDTSKTYAFNNINGKWFKITDSLLEKKNNVSDTLRYQILNDGNTLKDYQENIEYEIVTGEYIIDRYLLDDLYETDKVELQYNLPNFLVGKMLPVSFERACTMGTAAIWKYIMLAWSYENNLAVPELVETHKFTGGLSRLLSVGYVDRIVKLDYNSLYPSIILSYYINSPIDTSGVMSALLEYILTQREYYKGLKGKFGKQAKKIKKQIEENLDLTKEQIEELKIQAQKSETEAVKNDKLQLPLKITGNGFFGSYGSGTPFPHSDLVCAEKTTCIGRMCLRLMIYHFTKIGYKPIVGDTDGFNFQMPKNECFRYTEGNPYISNGMGRNSEKDKAYTGVDADVAEFEDLYLSGDYIPGINKMGLGVDEYCDATINFSRKNYADLLDNGKIKLVGNSIKSKKMPLYIEKFLDKGIRLLLNGKGKEFLEEYYNYVEKIQNLQIPLKEIATVGKIKTSINTYKDNCKQLTKGGTKKARQAWYELAIKHNLDVKMGDTIYYINTGNKKGDSDVKRLTKFYYTNNKGEKIDYVVDENGEPLTDKKGNTIDLTKAIEKDYNKLKKDNPEEFYVFNGDKKEKRYTLYEFGLKKYPNLKEEDIVLFNCELLDNNIVEDEEDHLCTEDFQYNTDKYIDMFNKRITPLLVCFDRSIRITVNAKGKEVSNILITDQKERKVFTEEECHLVSGQPYKSMDQDTFEQLMTIEDKEIKFWLSIDEEPPYTKECGINWVEVVDDYKQRMKQYEEESVKSEISLYEKIVNEMTEDEINKVMEDGILPDKLLKLIYLDEKTNKFMSNKHDIPLGSLSDLYEKIIENTDED